MNCARCHELLPALAGGELTAAERSSCQGHVDGCPGCAARLRELGEAVSLLQRLGRSTAPPAGFQQALHQRLAAEHVPPTPLGARLWRLLERLRLDSAPRLGLVAACAAGLVLLPLALRPRGESTAAVFVPDEQIAASFRVPSQRIAVVQLDFVSDDPLEDVEFQVTLPSGLQFIDGGRPLSERTLSWGGSLASGSNPIPLAVRGLLPGRYRVVAQARGPGLEVRHNILLEVVPS
jgi:hypothetical protein